jgi:HEAT repeat protein
MVTSRQLAGLAESIRALCQGDKQAQIAALHALGRSQERGAIPALVSALESEDPDIRALAMAKLAFSGAKAVVPAILKHLNDPDPRVRQHALYALQRLGASSAANKIAAILLGDANDVVRLNAAGALAAVGSRRHAPAFARALLDRSPHVVFVAIKALAALTPREVHLHVLKLARDPKRWARVPETHRDVILRLLHADLDKKSVAALLRDTVREGIRQARRTGGRPFNLELMAAAGLLSEIGDPTGVPVLMEGLKGGEYSQQSAAVGLGRLKERSAVPGILAGPMKNGFYPVMLRAVHALGEIGDVRALPALAAFFNDRVDDFPVERSLAFSKDDPDLRLTALVAMGKIAAQSLEEAGDSPDAFQRNRVAELMGVPW